MSILERIPVPLWFARFVVWCRRVPVNRLCPACGHCKGKIHAVTDGTRVAVEHDCLVCGWVWQEPTVLVIEPALIVDKLKAAPPDKNEAAFMAAGRDKSTKAGRAVNLGWMSGSAQSTGAA